ncbi:GNAT family N-acetyltransferase [Aquihabitans daechungensis]|uniref:GNAT family N-acetyltransferase n=1 Tax=Aquihabitans daechungensis TaxID=1052257 RepID=UPI003BA02155
MTLRLEQAALDDVPWDDLAAHPDATIAQTRAWLAFLQECHGAEPVAARVVVDGDETVGWYRGAQVRRFGVRILGSPLRGWSTGAMGFTLGPAIDRVEAIAALRAFAFGELRCHHLEVADQRTTPDQVGRTRLHPEELPGWELDLRRSDDDLLAGMNQMARRNIRKAARDGVQIEAVDPHDADRFVADHAALATEAFARRGRKPPFGPERVAALVRHLGPTGHLLLLRATDPGGTTISTGIFPGLPGAAAGFWTGATTRSTDVPSSEALMWEAMQRWRALGAVRFDLGGGGPYKEKFGGEPVRLVRLHGSRIAALDTARRVVVEAERRRRLRRARRAIGAK